MGPEEHSSFATLSQHEMNLELNNVVKITISAGRIVIYVTKVRLNKLID